MKGSMAGLIHLDRLGLESNPFPVAPDASNYFMSNTMQENLAEILHCIDARKGFVLISGDVGLGKTTLSRRLLRDLESKEVSTALVLNTFLQGEALIAAINRDFGIEDNAGMEQRLAALNAFLLARFRQGGNCVIMIDDAQNLSLESLELIRQISNLETEQEKLVQILLIAQPEILDTLARSDIRQLNSRIALNVRMPSLSRAELRRYVQFRLQRAGGGEAGIGLTASALAVLYSETGGVPRRVNLIMDRCLYVAAAYDQRRINALMLQRAARELQMAPKRPHGWRFPSRTVAAAVVVAALLLASPIRGPWLGWRERAAAVLGGYLEGQGTDPARDTLSRQAATQAPRLAARASVMPRLVRVKKFLAGYGLAEQAAQFVHAMDTSTLAELTLNPGAWRVRVKKVGAPPAENAFHYVQADGSSRWVVLWQPVVEFPQFYFDLRSPGVETLQNMLAELGYYRYARDGIVGARTVAAIARFQSSVGLVPTGNPDSDTLIALQGQLATRQKTGAVTGSLAAQVGATTRS